MRSRPNNYEKHLQPAGGRSSSIRKFKTFNATVTRSPRNFCWVANIKAVNSSFNFVNSPELFSVSSRVDKLKFSLQNYGKRRRRCWRWHPRHGVQQLFEDFAWTDEKNAFGGWPASLWEIHPKLPEHEEQRPAAGQAPSQPILPIPAEDDGPDGEVSSESLCQLGKKWNSELRTSSTHFPFNSLKARRWKMVRTRNSGAPTGSRTLQPESSRGSELSSTWRAPTIPNWAGRKTDLQTSSTSQMFHTSRGRRMLFQLLGTKKTNEKLRLLEFWIQIILVKGLQLGDSQLQENKFIKH